MSKQENKIQSTQPALLIARGWIAEQIGLPGQLEAVILKTIALSSPAPDHSSGFSSQHPVWLKAFAGH